MGFVNTVRVAELMHISFSNRVSGITNLSNQQCPTLDMSQLYCGNYATPTVCPTQTSLTSLAHELHYVVSANYYVAVIRETTGAEDHM